MSQNFINPVNYQEIKPIDPCFPSIKVDKVLFNEVDQTKPKKTKNSKAGIRLKKSEAYLQPNIKALKASCNECSNKSQKSYFLPEDFKVYSKGTTVTNNPMSMMLGFEEKTLPTYNHYMGEDGGYVAIYTHDEENSVYPVSKTIFVAGMIRVKGEYEDRVFVPKGYKIQPNDFIKYPEIIEVCDKHFPELKGKMWLGGDTSGFVGII